jgi:hypothetical protein
MPRFEGTGTSFVPIVRMEWEIESGGKRLLFSGRPKQSVRSPNATGQIAKLLLTSGMGKKISIRLAVTGRDGEVLKHNCELSYLRGALTQVDVRPVVSQVPPVPANDPKPPPVKKPEPKKAEAPVSAESVSEPEPVATPQPQAPKAQADVEESPTTASGEK